MAVGRGWRGMRARGRWKRSRRLAPALGATLAAAALSASAGAWSPGFGAPGLGALLIGPLLAGSRLSTRRTATVAACALLLAIGVGSVRQLVAEPGFAAEFLALLAGGGLAVRNAARNGARDAELAQAQRVARAAQQAILRPVSAQVGGVQVCTRHHCPVAGASVAGDLYDVVHTPYGTRLVVGDVRGHGLDALAITAAALGAFRELAYLTPRLTELTTALDARIGPSLGDEDFVTAVFAEFAPGEVRLVNCGHPAPLRAGRQLKLLQPPELTPPLGLHPTPRQHRVYLETGDLLLFYTDGLTDARDADGTGFPLLERVGDALDAPSPADALDALHGMATAHTGGPLTDDLALVLCEPVSAKSPSPGLTSPDAAASLSSPDLPSPESLNGAEAPGAPGPAIT